MVFAGRLPSQASREHEGGASLVPNGSVVSSEEIFFPVLHAGRDVHIYPEGIGIADRIVVTVNPQEGASPRYLGAVNFRGPKAQLELNLGLMQKLADLGFDLDHPERVAEWAILTKHQRTTPVEPPRF